MSPMGLSVDWHQLETQYVSDKSVGTKAKVAMATNKWITKHTTHLIIYIVKEDFMGSNLIKNMKSIIFGTEICMEAMLRILHKIIKAISKLDMKPLY